MGKRNIARWVYYVFGEDWGGTPSPPGSTRRLNFGEPDDDGRPMYFATTENNDGFDLWLGTRHQWHVFYRADQARKLAWFILWDWWFKSTWFGLKRRIWYWALHIQTADMMAAREEG